MPSWNSACVPTTMRTSPEAIASSALLRVRAGCEPDSSATGTSERLEPVAQVAPVLLGQQLGRRHQRHLQAAADGARRRRARRPPSCRSRRRPAAGAPSACCATRSRVDFAQRARLRAGERERQRGEEARRELRRVGERAGRIGLEAALAQLQREVMRQQLLEGEPPLRRVAPGGELGELRRRAAAGAGTRAPHRSGGRPCRQRAPPAGIQSRSARALELAQRLGDQRAQPALRHALGERDRSASASPRAARPPASTRRYSGCTISSPSGPRRTSPKQRSRVPRARPCCWRAGEIEEAQRQQPGAVGDAAQQLPAAAIGDFGELDLAFDHRARCRATSAPIGDDARAILVAQRQHEQQVRDAA